MKIDLTLFRVLSFAIVLIVSNVAFCYDTTTSTTAKDEANASDANANDASSSAKVPDKKNTEIRLAVGAKSMFVYVFDLIPPNPFSFLFNLDHGPLFRFQMEHTQYIFANASRTTIGAGVAARAYGKNAPTLGGFQFKMPLLLEFGFFIGDGLGVGDAHNDDFNWFIWGPSTGLDFTWWKAGKAGFTFAFKAGYMFKIDRGSYYSSYGLAEDKLGAPEVSLLFGVAFNK